MKRGGFLNEIADYPWWINLVFGIMLLCVPSIAFYYLQFNPNRLLLIIHNYIAQYVFYLLGFVLFMFSLSDWYKKRKRSNLFKNNNELEDLFNLSWRDFEYLVTEVFAREGYEVRQVGGAKADGGIDLWAFGKGQKIIVQCKLWKKKSIGVTIVREMLGVAVHEGATQVYIVTCGYFTKDAKDFAKNKGMKLIDGRLLIQWIVGLKNNC